MKTAVKSLSFAFCLLFNLNSYAQNFEHYKEQQRQHFQQVKEQQNQRINKLRQEYSTYIEERNREFAKLVSESWKNFHTIKGEKFSSTPKPKLISEFQERKHESGPQRLESINEVNFSVPKHSLDIAQIPASKDPLSVPFLTTISFTFYGQQLSYQVDPSVFKIVPGIMSKDEILSVLNSFLETNYEVLLDQIFETTAELNLNDWGLFLLVEAISTDIVKNPNYARILSWSMLNLSGYNVKIGLSGNTCYLMIPSIQKMYGTYSLNVKGERYYIIDCKGDRISTYEHDFDGVLKRFDFNLNKVMSLKEDGKYWIYNTDEEPDIRSTINKNLMDFYNDYPLVDPSVYFNSDMALSTKEYLYQRLSPALEGLTEVEKISYLLDFVQKEFKYKSDRDQFGREKFFFPEELFYYPYSDCEDRSVLFAYIVRWLTESKVIGLQYSGHMSTAVALGNDFDGDYVEYQNKVYTICDPTFKNAPIGLGMEEFKDEACRIIPTQNNYYQKELLNKYWEQLTSSGAIVTSDKNFVFDSKNNCYIAGSYREKLSISDKFLTTKPRNTNAFIACFNNQKELSWIRDFNSATNNLVNGLAILNNKILLNVSSFDQFITTGSCVAYREDGSIDWTNSWKFDSIYYNRNTIRTIHLLSDGKIIEDKSLFSGAPVINSNIYVSENEIVLNYNYKSAFGLRREDISINSYAQANISQTLKKVYNEFIQNNYEPYTAAVMAVFDVLKQNGVTLSGQELFDLLKESNPKLLDVIPELFDNLSKIKYFANENGLIVLRTLKHQKVAFFKMYFSDQATVKLVDVNNSKTKIECLTGVQVGNKIMKLPLNCISVDLVKGNFQFDYGSNNSKAIVNLKDDILKI